MAEYVNVGKTSDFTAGKIQNFDIHGKDVCVVNFRDRFFAFLNECTHLGVPLSSAYLTDSNEIICLLHDSVYSMETGKIVDGPAFDDLPIYNVRVEGDDVLVGQD